MKYKPAGELFHHLGISKRFVEQRAKFYTACICIAIGFIHDEGRVYRDLNLENVIMGEKGYISIVNFNTEKFLSK